ncbi:MAG: hypothetical protein AAGA86_16135, partial [Bacteroidota bacterium]
MDQVTKVTFLWVLIILGIALHTVLETAESLYFTTLPETPYNEGIPGEAHGIYILALMLPMLLALSTLFFKSKTFVWISLVYAALLGLLNVFHVIEDGSM